MSHRDIFLEDVAFSRQLWDSTISKGLHHFKHPSCSHIAADYGKEKYAKGNYNFNVVGEFSLSIAAIFRVDCPPSTVEGKHNVIIWPDRIVLSNLEDSDVSNVLEACLSDKVIHATTFEGKLSQNAQITSGFDSHYIFSAVNQYSSPTAAQRTLDWFAKAFSEKNNASGNKPYKLYLSSMMEGHRSSTSLLVLPSEDSFSYVSSIANVESIVKKLEM